MPIDPQAVQRYPLEWPLGWKRHKSFERRNGQFKAEKRAINVERATYRLQEQLDKLGAKNATLSTNLSLNLRGIPRGDERPSDPGVAVYFSFKGKATVLACDSYMTVADNIAAIAAHIDALRRIDRYGVGTIEQALAGYKALPADTAADWRAVFGIPATQNIVTLDDVNREYQRLARQYHPDITHDDGARMAWLNRARDYAYSELQGK